MCHFLRATFITTNSLSSLSPAPTGPKSLPPLCASRALPNRELNRWGYFVLYFTWLTPPWAVNLAQVVL